jgi:uncharacterized protein YecE (DUF72 family)
MSNQTKGILRIGTSGIVVPGSKETYPPEFQQKSRLNYYSSLFNTLEINSTFRKIPRVSTFENWSSDVPKPFLFTVKLWKEITHIKKLAIDLDNINNFLTAAKHIGNKKGCLLVQFPGSITADYHRQVEEILQRLQEQDSKGTWKKAIEFRSVTWYNSETYWLLHKYNSTIVIHDMPKSNNLSFDGELPFGYWRFHGPTGDYRGSYSDAFLAEQAEKISGLLRQGKDVYVYFNNTMGDAFGNAMSLKSLVKK